jgi:hypothetical protein
MRSFSLFVSICAFAGLLTSFLGILFFDWTITGTLPYSIVSILIFIQGIAATFTRSKRFKQIGMLLFTIQVIVCFSYFFELFPFALLWKWMLMIALLGIQLGISSIAAVENQLTFKHKLLLFTSIISCIGLLLALMNPSFGMVYLIGLSCSSILAILIILSAKKTSH